MVVGYDIVGPASLHEVYDILCAEVLLDGEYGIQHYYERLTSLNLLLRVQAVVTVLAVILLVFLAEVVEQQLSAAYRRLGVGCCLLQQLPSDVLLCHWFPLHELLQLLQVLVCVEGYAYALASVASCAPGLLVVSLKRFWYVIVYDEPHVGLVDTHTEGYCRHDDIHLLHEETVLCLVAGHSVQSGVVCLRAYVVCLENGCQLLDLLPRQAVYYAALALVLAYEAYYLLVYVVSLGPHLVVEVGAVE